MIETDWPQVTAWRKQRRTELRAARQALSPAERERAAERIRATLGTAFPELCAAVLAGYWPLAGEPDLRPLLAAQVAAGGVAALPVVTARNAPLAFRRWTPETALTPGAWNIPVPTDTPAVRPTVLLVPLVGFDDAGYRLGNGGGYYDRTLAACDPLPLTLGVGYAAGRLATIHPQPHDRPLDVIVTESGIHWPRPGTGTADATRTPSSPVCYAPDAAPGYFGEFTAPELEQALGGLFVRARAWAVSLARATPRSRPAEDTALHLCVGLLRLLREVGGAAPLPDDAAAPTTPPPVLAAELTTLATRVRDDALHGRLRALADALQAAPAAH